MAQAIITKYLGSRIKATCWNGTVTISKDFSLSRTESHREAAEALVAQLDNNWMIHSFAEMPDGESFAFIIEHKPDLTTGDHEYLVEWGIDVQANSHDDAVRKVAATFFRQDIGDGTPDTACVFTVDGKTVDLSK